MNRNQAPTIARQFLELARPVIDVEQAYLFGSHARNQGREDSDIDIGLFVTHLDGDYLETMQRLFRLRRRLDVRIEPHLFVSGHDTLGFADHIARTGQAL